MPGLLLTPRLAAVVAAVAVAVVALWAGCRAMSCSSVQLRPGFQAAARRLGGLGRVSRAEPSTGQGTALPRTSLCTALSTRYGPACDQGLYKLQP